MRVYVPILLIFASFMVLITLIFGGCSTTYPSYYDDGSGGQSGMDGDCTECHMIDGDGITPPGNHWEGDGVDPGHDACTQCHSTH